MEADDHAAQHDQDSPLWLVFEKGRGERREKGGNWGPIRTKKREKTTNYGASALLKSSKGKRVKRKQLMEIGFRQVGISTASLCYTSVTLHITLLKGGHNEGK
ncbi:MAG: hypothetical protein R2940_04435 [Syntrophotaleaceae bacterium]